MSKEDGVVRLTSKDFASYEFVCKHEYYPRPLDEPDELFQYARWLQVNNQLKRDVNINSVIERLYRIAAEHGHAKANINLQNGAMRGYFSLRGHEHLRLSEQLIDNGVAAGYLLVGYFLQDGTAGLEKNPEMAQRFIRKAADEGNAQAQYYVGDKLAPLSAAPHVARKMRRCAAEQGHGRAAVALGVNLRMDGLYREALEVLQMGVAGGYDSAASRLRNGFRSVPSDEWNYLGEEQDLERARRYTEIWKMLADYSYASPTVPEINEIVPLPPAKLPPWDGKLQWLEARLANIPPEKPSEALIVRLADAKVLDPATGKPMPGSPAFKQASFPVMRCRSGDLCPESGYWEIMWNSREETALYFEQGQIMPKQTQTWTRHRIWPLPDTVHQCETSVEWGMLG
ncbi:SEL1-like repeat protein [Pseudomonas putida]